MTALTLDDFDFDLPPELIAQQPAAQRTGARLLDGTGPSLWIACFPNCAGCCGQKTC